MGTDEDVLEDIPAMFEQLASVSRSSHHEEQIGTFLPEWVRSQGFDPHWGEAGSVVLDDSEFVPVNTPITVVPMRIP